MKYTDRKSRSEPQLPGSAASVLMYQALAALMLAVLPVWVLPVWAGGVYTVETWDRASGAALIDSAGRLVLPLVSPLTNLAAGRPAIDQEGDKPRITDGGTSGSSVWNTFRPQVFNFFIQIDLEEPRLVNRVIVRPVSGAQGLTDFMKGYSIQTSLDNIVFKERLLNTRNLESLIDTSFEAVTARFVRVQIKAIDRIHKVQVGELEVYGEGFDSQTSVELPVTDFGVSAAKNFGLVRWDAQLEDQTELTLQFRTGPTAAPGTRWSDWSEPSSLADGTALFLPEPRRYMQIRANFATSDPTATARLSRVLIDYDDLLVASATARVLRNVTTAESDTLPNTQTVAGQESSFTYALSVNMGTGSGFERLRLKMPNRVTVDQVLVDDVPLDEGSGYALSFDAAVVNIAFSEPITQNATIEVEFRTTLFDETNVFSGELLADDQTGNPQQIGPVVDGSDKIEAVGLIDKVLDRAKITVTPNPFSPDGDNLFDVVNFSYELAKLSVPRPVTLQIFDLSGRPIRRVDLLQKSGFQTVTWDGHDDDNTLVAPGIYLFQVEIDSGDGIRFNGAVAVAY